jgi:PKD repeat protein
MVVDMQAPEFVVTMPANVTVNCDQVPTMMQLTAGGVNDNCTPSNNLVINQTENSTQGANPANCSYYTYAKTRHWVVTDAVGNSASYTQTVTVHDITAPNAICRDIQVLLGTNGSATIAPILMDNGSTDNCASTPYLTFAASQTTFTASNLGLNNVTLHVTDPCGNVGNCISHVNVINAISVPPTAAYAMTVMDACSLPIKVQYTDVSTNNPTAWEWNFQGGTPATSTDQNPIVSYSASGNYLTTLKATNAYGSTTETDENLVKKINLPDANFSNVVNGGQTSFTNLSQDAVTYYWNFGDGNTSTDANPVYTYTAPGTYLVMLAASNGCGTSIIQHTVHVNTLTATHVANDWLESFLLYPNPNPGIFTVEVVGRPEQEMDFILYNSIGQLIKQDKADFRSGKLKQVFNYADLPSGVYTLGVRSGEQMRYVKVVIQQ